MSCPPLPGAILWSLGYFSAYTRVYESVCPVGVGVHVLVQVRLLRRMAYIGPILTELEIIPYYGHTYA